MSLASRIREAARRQTAYDTRYRRGYPDWESFRAWQRDTLAALCGPWSRWEDRSRPLMSDERLVPTASKEKSLETTPSQPAIVSTP